MKYIEHITIEGERWDLIAWRYYRSVRLQSEIINANRHLFIGPPVSAIPAVLPAGLTLRVPVLEQERNDANLPPWKRGAPTPREAVIVP